MRRVYNNDMFAEYGALHTQLNTSSLIYITVLSAYRTASSILLNVWQLWFIGDETRLTDLSCLWSNHHRCIICVQILLLQLLRWLLLSDFV